MYTHNNKDSIRIKQNQKELKGEIDKFTFLLGDFSILFTMTTWTENQ